MNRRKSGVGVIIAVIILSLVLFGVLLPIFFAVTTPIENFANTNQVAQGAFTGLMGSVFTFMTTWWLWSPILMVLLPLIIYGLIRAQQRGPEEAI